MAGSGILKTLQFLDDLKDLNRSELNIEQRSMVSNYISFLERKLKVIQG